MWVKPGDLFRPSADPEISDREAETEFRRQNNYVTVSDDSVKWFNELKMRSYSVDGAIPEPDSVIPTTGEITNATSG